MNSNFLRTSRQLPCPICSKPDWCLIAKDGSVAICQRVKSETVVGEKGAGWLHRLDSHRLDFAFRELPKRVPVNYSKQDWPAMHQRCCQRLTTERLAWLANELNLSVDSLKKIQVGYHCGQNSFTFPMRDADGNVIGLRTRSYDGSKRAILESKAGLFFAPGSINRNRIVVAEGPTDAVALYDAGVESVVGRASCRGNVQQLRQLVLNNKPESVWIVADRDQPGIDGANDLAESLIAMGYPRKKLRGITPPSQFNDIRDWLESDFDGLKTTFEMEGQLDG